MDTHSMIDRVAALVQDIEAIPGVYERLAGGDWIRPALGAVLDRAPDQPPRIVLTGLGSSRYAALDVEARLRAAGVETVVEPASSDVPVEAGAGRVTIAISSSGRTAETIEAARRHRERGAVLAITRDAGSPLAEAADAVAVLPVPAEESGVATTTYAATLAVLVHLAAALGARGPFASPEEEILAGARAARAALDSRAGWLPDALATARSAEAITVLAPWSERGQAEQVGLLLREGPRCSAEVFETAEWLHVGIYTALPGTVTLVLAGSPADAEVARTIAGRSGRVIAVGDRSGDAAASHSLAPAATIPSPAGLGRFVGPALLAAELWRLRSGG
jgi:glutamine---fructose-6-phosphate transaminase (isomerizing)